MTTKRRQKPKDTTEADSSAGVSCAAASGYVVPSKPGYYWLRHATPLAGRWQPVMVDTVHGVLGFKKFGWEGWMAISESLHLGIEWGGECLHPHTQRSATAAERNHERHSDI